MKTLTEISWNVPEPTYRADSALSYSTLAKYERDGFHSIEHLGDKIETPSTIFGSAVDAILTGGNKEFSERFMVCDYNITEGGLNVCKRCAELYGETYEKFALIPEDLVSNVAKEVGFWQADKWDKRRYSEVLKTGDVDKCYASYSTSDKTIISTETFNEVVSAVKALRSAPASKFLFANNKEGEPQRYYQLKFKATLNGINYRCMSDLLLVDYENKIIYPFDLKTSSHYEDEFHKSFVKWRYDIQARLYWRIIRDNLDRDEYFKDFELKDFTFIVVNRNTLIPLTWNCSFTQQRGTIYVGKQNQYELRDPEEIGAELHFYLTNESRVPKGIHMEESNDLLTKLNTL